MKSVRSLRADRNNSGEIPSNSMLLVTVLLLIPQVPWFIFHALIIQNAYCNLNRKTTMIFGCCFFFFPLL